MKACPRMMMGEGGEPIMFCTPHPAVLVGNLALPSPAGGEGAVIGAQSPSAPSQPPARMQRHDAAGHALETGPGESGIAYHLRERLGIREAADRFDQIAIGFAV